MIADGLANWSEEKVAVVAQRGRWLAIGRALEVGRSLYPSNVGFGRWCAHGASGTSIPPTESKLLTEEASRMVNAHPQGNCRRWAPTSQHAPWTPIVTISLLFPAIGAPRGRVDTSIYKT